MELYFLKRDITGLLREEMYKGAIISYEKIDEEFVDTYTKTNLKKENNPALYSIICRFGAVGLENGDFFIDINRNITGAFAEIKGNLLSMMRNDNINKIV